MNERPSQQWNTLLQALELYESSPLNQDGQTALERFKSAASQIGFDATFDIPAIQFLYKFHGRNVSLITEQDIRAISREMEEIIPTNPSALHFRNETKAKEIQWLMNATGTKNIIALGFELAKYADGTHPLSLNSRMDHLTEVIQKSHLKIKKATVLDAFAGVGWMDVPLMRCGAKTIIHVDIQASNKQAYERLMKKSGEQPSPYIVADIFTMDPALFQNHHIQGITAHLPWLDSHTGTTFPLTNAFIRFADSILPPDGWILTTLDSTDIPMVKKVAHRHNWVASQQESTLVLQRG